MQKVKVTRYISGRRPDYAQADSSSESSDEEEGFGVQGEVGSPGRVEGEEEVVKEVKEEEEEAAMMDDPRLRRLRERRSQGDTGR